MQLSSIRHIIAALLMLLTSAMSLSAYDITGRIIDDSGEAMMQASVRVLTPKDSTQIKGTVTNTNGNYKISGLANGSYILEASYVGYNPVCNNIKVAGKSLKLDPITLSESSIMLNEATVVGIKTPIKVMQDTVEFNADSYKTAPNAVVEDLLKRLPGVEVDSEGKITANGKEVTKILVDGKEFFSDDPKVASKNLPVNMVEKLQVVDRKSDLARITGVDDGEEETVINLTVKKGMNNGWFGNVEAGYGTDNRYKGSFNVNRFWNGNQFTIIGGANNVNDLGFTDGTAGRFRRFGGSTGITTSQALGINFNVGKEEIFRVGGDVMYSHSERDTRQQTNRRYLFADSTSYYDSGRASRDKGHNVRADFRVQGNPDTCNTWAFRPTIPLNYNNSYSSDSSLTRAGDPAMSEVVRSINNDRTRGSSVEVGGVLIYNHKFRSKPGRSVSLFMNFRMSNVREKSDSYSWNKFYLFNDSIDLADRFTDNHTWSNSVSARVTWTEPIGNVKNGNFITLAYRMQYRWNNTDRLTYDYPVSFPDGWDAPALIGSDLELYDELANSFRNDFSSQDIRIGYKRVNKNSNTEVGISAVPQMSRSINLTDERKTIPTRWVWNYAPFLRYRYRPTKTKSLSLDYMGRSSQPSMSQLQPVADMSDPLRIVIGNPNLKPTFNHNIRVRFHNFAPEAQRSIMTMADVRIAQNSIISRTDFNKETGGQKTTYENVNGVWSAMAMNMISFPLKNRSFTINNHLMMRYSHSVGYNNGQRNNSGSLGLNESFGLAWRPENVELEFRPRYGLQYVKNTLQLSGQNTVHSYGASLYGTYNTPFGLVLNTDLNYSATSGYSQGYDTRQWMWNASISYQFLRDRAATVTLRAYDLLHQQSNIRRNITANYIDDTSYNSLTRYFMVSVSYKFNTFGKGERPKDRNESEFGPHRGPRGGGRPPMGPPRM